MHEKIKDSNVDFLFKAILELKDMDECYDFFEDLCTVTELKALSQRIVVAKCSETTRFTAILLSKQAQAPQQSAELTAL